MRIGRLAWIVVAVGFAAGVPAYAEVHITLQDGRVAISAKDATVAEIMAEWARITGMTIVNADRLPHERETIELQNVTERQALDVLLRATGGYVAHGRAGGSPSASLIDSVFVMERTAPIAPPPPAVNARRAAPAAPVAVEQIAEVTAAQEASTLNVTDDDSPTPDPIPPVALPVLTPDEERAVAVTQSTIRARRALETANPRDFVFPKK